MTSTQSIIKFNKDRNLITFNGVAELAMLNEELAELKQAILENDTNGIIDALNDLRVLATGGVWKLGQDPELSLKQTCKEILSRTGTLGDDGKWLKNSTSYVADYNLSKRKLDNV